MTKKFMALVTAMIFALSGLAMATPAAAVPTLGPAVFLVPHQDDEVLTFGASVKQHLLANREVHLVLLTDGSSSGECKKERTGTYPHPNFDATDGDVGNYTAVDRQACAAFRDQEFLDAAANAQANAGTGTIVPIIRTDRQQDGLLTKAYVRSVIQEYLDNEVVTGPVSFKAMTYKESAHIAPAGSGEGHADHDVTGEALRDAANATADPAGFDARFYVKPALWDNVAAGGYTRYSINTALDAYRKFGQYSVVGEFCEQYGLAKSQRTSLDNGRPCPAIDNVNYPKISGGADSKVHLLGQ